MNCMAQRRTCLCRLNGIALYGADPPLEKTRLAGYNLHTMDTTTLIAGIDYTDYPDLADTAAQSRTVLATVFNVRRDAPAGGDAEEEAPDEPESPVQPAVQPSVRVFEWNRASPLSARTLILHAENTIGPVREALLVFDTASAQRQFPLFSAEYSSRAADELITGYLFLTAELLARFSRHGGGTLAFLLRDQPSLAETILVPSLKNRAEFSAAGVFASMAAKAFKAFSENISASHAEDSAVRCILASVDPSISYEAAGSWLFDYIGELDAVKNARSPKQLVQWIKYGSRPSSGFQFFKR